MIVYNLNDCGKKILTKLIVYCHYSLFIVIISIEIYVKSV